MTSQLLTIRTNNHCIILIIKIIYKHIYNVAWIIKIILIIEISYNSVIEI